MNRAKWADAQKSDVNLYDMLVIVNCEYNAQSGLALYRAVFAGPEDVCNGLKITAGR